MRLKILLVLILLLSSVNIKIVRKWVDKMWYPIIRRYYLQGLYTDANLVVFVTAGMITEEEMLALIEEKEKLESEKNAS